MFADESPEWNLDFDGSDTCEECGEAAASIHLVRIENGAVNHVRLCRRCAENLAGRAEGMALLLAVPTILRRTESAEEANTWEKNVPYPSRPDSQVCGVCGTTLSDLKESGMVGCSVCYQVFSDYLRTLVQGSSEPPTHLGKVPHYGSEGDQLRHEKIRLQRMLRELIECERFEEAASVRDKLAEVERSLSGGS